MQLARPPVPVLAAARGRATGPLGSNQRSLRRPPGPVWPPASAWRRRCARSRFLRGAKNGLFGGPARGRPRLRRGAPPRGRGGRRGGAGTEGTSSYRIVAERARLRVFPIARSRASAEPITVSRAAASARASTCDNEHGRASPLGASWLRRRFSPLSCRSLPLPLVAVRNPRPAPHRREGGNSKTVTGKLERPPRASPLCLRSPATAFWGSTTRWSTTAAAPGRDTRRGSVGQIFGDSHGHPRRGGALAAADGPGRGGGPA